MPALVTLAFALGCAVFVLGLVLGPLGNGMRRIGGALVLAPLVASVFFGIAREALPRSAWNGAVVVLALLLASMAAYAVLQLRARLGSKNEQMRIKEKRPIDGGREPSLLALLREQLKDEDEP